MVDPINRQFKAKKVDFAKKLKGVCVHGTPSWSGLWLIMYVLRLYSGIEPRDV